MKSKVSKSALALLKWLPSLILLATGTLLFFLILQINHKEPFSALVFFVLYWPCVASLLAGAITIPAVFNRLPIAGGFWMRLAIALALWAAGATAAYFSASPVTEYVSERFGPPAEFTLGLPPAGFFSPDTLPDEPPSEGATLNDRS